MDKTNKKHDGKALRKEGQTWLERIKDCEKLEKTWTDNADRAVKVYSCDDPTEAYDFNILYSNVETIVPAIINSPPAPDVRRRFGDADEAAKEFSELVERAIRVQVDDSKLQVELEATAQDAFLAGRGVVRLRFKADITGEPELDEIAELADDDGQYDDEGSRGEYSEGDGSEAAKLSEASSGAGGESVTNERITFEAVSWRDYRHGPAKRWEDRKWDAFRHSMPQDDVDEFQDPSMISGQMNEQERAEVGESDSDIVVWEIWCRKTRKVKFVKETTGEIIKVIDDPLGLSTFFPIATPVQPVEITARLMPINPFAVYQKLADELDDTTKRIGKLLDAMRVKGWYAGSAGELENVVELDDNEFAPIKDAEVWAAHGGIDGAIAFWPIDRFIAALKELYTSREQTKQSIYEITGISDIVRGASKASETLGAQEIKSQWGSLRIQKAQRAMERCARDLFVMMSEIIPDKFSPETLQKMTGVQLIPSQQDLTPVQPQIQQGMPEEAIQKVMQQAQAQEQKRIEKLNKLQELNGMLHEKVSTMYRVDVETDSTVRADLTRQKQEVSEFLKGSGAYFQSVGPLVQQGMLPPDVAIEIYASNARMFNLGKSTEDAIDSMIEQAKEKAKQPPAPNPEAIKAKAEMDAQQMDAQIKQQQAQMDAQTAKLKIDFATQEMQGKMALAMAQQQAEGQKAQSDAAIAVLTQQIKALEVDIKNVDLEIKRTDLHQQVAKVDETLPLHNPLGFEHFVGLSNRHKALMTQAKKLSVLDQPLLIEGETGTGKEMLAKACHSRSGRASKPFLVLSCASMPDDVAETELFGHAPGSFNHEQGHKGIFEQANGGTVFLDEIGEMSSHLQIKLLRFLQDGNFRRVGAEDEMHVDVRIIASTKHNLAELSEAGRFREDLYYRLNVLTLTIPPLRKRSNDVAPLLELFVTKHAQQLGLDKPEFDQGLVDALVNYQWPGNMRQLDNMVLRALTEMDGPILKAEHFNLPQPQSVGGSSATLNLDGSLDEIMRDYESQILERLYQSFPSSRKLAKRLNVSHTSIANKLRDYGIRKN